jgi:hypothetical protein
MTVETIKPAQLTKAEARAVTNRIKGHLENLWVDVLAAWLGEAHIALGYTSWKTYCSTEFGSDYLRVPKGERQRIVALLAEHEMPASSIAATINASHVTVHKDLKELEETGQFVGSEKIRDDAGHYRTRRVDTDYRPTPEPADQPKPEPKPEPPAEQPEQDEPITDQPAGCPVKKGKDVKALRGMLNAYVLDCDSESAEAIIKLLETYTAKFRKIA